MFKNYLKSGWRNIQRQKGYSFLNIAGQAYRAASSNPAESLKYE